MIWADRVGLIVMALWALLYVSSGPDGIAHGGGLFVVALMLWLFLRALDFIGVGRIRRSRYKGADYYDTHQGVTFWDRRRP